METSNKPMTELLHKNSSNKNVITKSEWRKHYFSWQKSTLSKAGYCKANGLKIPNFYYWCDRLQGENISDALGKENQFIAVRLKSGKQENTDEKQHTLTLNLPNHAVLRFQMMAGELISFIKELCDATTIIR